MPRHVVTGRCSGCSGGRHCPARPAGPPHATVPGRPLALLPWDPPLQQQPGPAQALQPLGPPPPPPPAARSSPLPRGAARAQPPRKSRVHGRPPARAAWSLCRPEAGCAASRGSPPSRGRVPSAQASPFAPLRAARPAATDLRGGVCLWQAQTFREGLAAAGSGSSTWALLPAVPRRWLALPG